MLSSPGRRALLVVHHTTSPSLQAMLEAVLDGAQTEEIEDVDVRVRPALAATAVDVLSADAFLLGTSANIGYMSGALKHFFDQIYYPCLTAKVGAGYGVYIHGASDTGGALRAIESICEGHGLGCGARAGDGAGYARPSGSRSLLGSGRHHGGDAHAVVTSPSDERHHCDCHWTRQRLRREPPGADGWTAIRIGALPFAICVCR